MIKLIASDIDGTLVPESVCRINPEFYDTIRKLKKQGIVFAAASGRQYSSMKTLLEPLMNDIFFIAGNGTNVMYQGEQIDSTSMVRADVEAAVNYMRGLCDCIYTVSTAECIYIEQRDEEFERLQRECYHARTAFVEDILKAPIQVQKMAIYRQKGVADILEQVISAWQDRFRVFQAGERWIDFVDYSADKGSALRKLQERLGVTPEETMVFGDNYNDLGMFEAAGESYAVAGAQEGVKKAARHTTASCEEEGVLKILKTLVKEEL